MDRRDIVGISAAVGLASLAFSDKSKSQSVSPNLSTLPFSVTGRIYPTQGTGNDITAIQTALNQCAAAGGGTVDLGNAIWNCSGSTGLSLDSTTTSLIGQGAILNFSTSTASSAITIIGSNSTYLHGFSHQISGFIINGNPSNTNGNGFYLNGSSSTTSTLISINNIIINSFYNNITFGQNTYAIQFTAVTTLNAVNAGLYIKASANGVGDAISFFKCNFAQNNIGILTDSFGGGGGLADFKFFGCSIDYSTNQSVYCPGDVIMEFYGCHFEFTYTANPPFYFTDNCAIKFYGGGLFPNTGASTPSYIFYTPTSYAPIIVLDGFFITPSSISGITLCLYKNAIYMVNMAYYTPFGTANGSTPTTIDLLSGNYLEYVMTANSTFPNPLNPFIGATITYMIQQPSGQSYTTTWGSQFAWTSTGTSGPPGTILATHWLKVTATYVNTTSEWYAYYEVF